MENRGSYKMYSRINKNKFTMFLFVFLCAVVTIIPLLSFKTYSGTDITFHVYRIEEMARNIKDGIFLPAIERNNMLGMGYFVDVFYPCLFLYIGAAITLIVGNPLVGFIGMILICNILSFYLLKKVFSQIYDNEHLGFFMAFFTILFPWRSINLLTVGFLGEYLAFPFVAIAVFGIKQLLNGKGYKTLVLGMVGLVYTHVISLMLVSIYVFVYCVINVKKILRKDIVLDLVKAVLFSVLIGSAFLAPFMYYITSDVFRFTYNFNALGVTSLLNIEISVWYKIAIQIVVIIGLYLLYVKKIKNSKNEEILKIVLALVYMLQMLTGLFPWEVVSMIPVLRGMQFSIRILPFIVTFVCHLFAIWIVDDSRFEGIFIPFFISAYFFIFTAMNAINPENSKIDFRQYSNVDGYVDGTYMDVVAAEYAPYDLKINGKYMWEIESVEYFIKNGTRPVFSENIEEYEFIRQDGLSYVIDVKTNTKTDVELPLTYYKGYIAYNGEEPVEVGEKDGKVFLKDVGNEKITVRFKNPIVQPVSIIISILGVLLIIIKKSKAK